MAWNLPEDQHKPKTGSDPWTGRQTKTEAQPPNLETLIKDAWLKAKRGLGGRPKSAPQPRSLVKWAGGLVVAVWLGLGVHYVDANRLTYALRLGVYQGQLSPGWQWRPWGLYQVKSMPQPMTADVSAEVMTEDLNLAKVSLRFNYQVLDPKAYLFSVQAPEAALQALASSALQRGVGQASIDALLSEKNPLAVVNAVKAALQASVDQAGLGLKIESVSIETVAIPDALQELFNKMNALYVTQTTERQKNAEYQQQVLPPAQLKAQQWLTEAKAYEQQAQIKAKADVADFLALLPSYDKNPRLTKYQLYTHSMTTLLSDAPTVVVDAKGPAPTIHIDSGSFKKAAPATDVAPVEPDIGEATETPNDSYGNVKGGYG